MAHVALEPDDVRALEQTRQRFLQLSSNLASLNNDLLQSNPLPQWSSLQTSATILGNNIKTLTDHLSKHSELFKKTVAYPATNYPGRTQEGLLAQLLRKKFEPHVETWVEEGRATQTDVGGAKARGETNQELWAWAQEWIGVRVAKYILEESGDNYTVDERENGIENVNTGLKRKLEDDGSSDEDDEDDEDMEDAGVEDTSAHPLSLGQAEPTLTELKKENYGKDRSVDEILKFSFGGFVADHGIGGKR